MFVVDDKMVFIVGVGGDDFDLFVGVEIGFVDGIEEGLYELMLCIEGGGVDLLVFVDLVVDVGWIVEGLVYLMK